MNLVDYSNLPEQVRTLIECGAPAEKIHEEMKRTDVKPEIIDSVMNSLKEISLQRRRTRGFRLGVTGSVLLVLGFVLTAVCYHSGFSIHLVMYSLTSVGVILLFAGMIDVLGW